MGRNNASTALEMLFQHTLCASTRARSHVAGWFNTVIFAVRVYNSQSSCVVVEQMAPLCGISPWQALLCKHDNFLFCRQVVYNHWTGLVAGLVDWTGRLTFLCKIIFMLSIWPQFPVGLAMMHFTVYESGKIISVKWLTLRQWGPALTLCLVCSML